MNRRQVLKGMLTVPVAGAIAGCRREVSTGRSSQGMLRIILNGPFGVVLDRDRNYRITAYVPPALHSEHELRFPGPLEVTAKEANSGQSAGHRFTLPDDGLDLGQGPPNIDQGFYDFYVPHIGKFDLPRDYFVALDLPRPDFITFIPPAQLVWFGGRPAFWPLEHILEYRISEPDKIRVKAGSKDQRPLPCSDLLKQYEEYWSRTNYSSAMGGELRNNLGGMLKSCASSDLCMLFGVGFDPQHPDPNPLAHGIEFFNKVLLPSFDPKLQKQLQPATCSPATGNGNSAALIPADLRYPLPQPRLLPVASVLDCQSGGIMGGTP